MNTACCTVQSFAKVNLTLDVMEKRPDGFHSIESIMQTIGLHDTLSIALEQTPGISVTCTVPGIPTDEKNLAYTAASAMLRHFGVEAGVSIAIDKRIPVEAGLGGGSSNAAAVIRGLANLWQLQPEPGELSHIAAGIGSDVPFFLEGGMAFVQGRGEQVISLPDLRLRWLLVVKPPFGVSTLWCYRRLDEMRSAWQQEERGAFSHEMLVCLERGDCARIPQLLGNDLEAPAFEEHPELRRIKSELIRTGSDGALMSGSGSAIFGLFGRELSARAAASALAGFGHTHVARTVGRDEALRA